MLRCFFDDSLPAFVRVLAAQVDAEILRKGVILREASGRLAFFAATEVDAEKADRIERGLRESVGNYAREDRPLVQPSSPGAQRVLNDAGARSFEIDALTIRYLDRRIVGADWLRSPEVAADAPPRFAFASLKGGVGRSTAISIVAAEAARRGENVLVVDLDLEAPGVGTMLLGDDRVPRFGALDYLVELHMGPFAPRDLDDFVGTSGLTRGSGLVDVVPVVGTRSREAPQNYLAKLSRAMIERSTPEGQFVPVRDSLRAMVSAFEQRRSYDLVMIDVRAGLAEMAAGPLLALGATVLLFGTAQRQTIEDFRYLFAHLQTLVDPGKPSPWRGLKVVHAKMQSAGARERFRDQLWDLFSEYIYEAEEAPGLETFNFAATASDAPHSPIPIPLDPAFADWSPVDSPDTLLQAYYERTYGDLLNFVRERAGRG